MSHCLKNTHPWIYPWSTLGIFDTRSKCSYSQQKLFSILVSFVTEWLLKQYWFTCAFLTWDLHQFRFKLHCTVAYLRSVFQHIILTVHQMQLVFCLCCGCQHSIYSFYSPAAIGQCPADTWAGHPICVSSQRVNYFYKASVTTSKRAANVCSLSL